MLSLLTELGKRMDCYLAVSNQIAKALLPSSLSQFSSNKGIDMASHSLFLRSAAIGSGGHVTALEASWWVI